MRSSSKHNKKNRLIRKKTNKNTIKKQKKHSQRRGGTSTRRTIKKLPTRRSTTQSTTQSIRKSTKRSIINPTTRSIRTGIQKNNVSNLINSVVSQAKKRYGKTNWESVPKTGIPKGLRFRTSTNMPNQYAYVTQEEDKCSMPINGKYPILCRQPLQHPNAPGTPFPQNFIKGITSNPDLVIGFEK